MQLAFRLITSLLLWILMACILVLFVLLPRDTQSHREGYRDVMAYHFTWSQYSENVQQFVSYVKKHKSLGLTKNEVPVEEELVMYGKKGLLLIIPSLLLSILLGITKGIFDFHWKGFFGNLFGKGFTRVGLSIPDFFFILLIQMGLTFLMHIGLPHIDLYGDAHWYNYVIPILFLSFYPAFMIARIVTQFLGAEKDQPYLRTAYAKGVPYHVVLWKHMLRNCWPKLLSHTMPIVITLVSGMFVVEFLTIFHGMGYRLITSLSIRTSIQAGNPLPIDANAVIGFGLAFMVFFCMVQLISQTITYLLVPSRKGVSK